MAFEFPTDVVFMNYLRPTQAIRHHKHFLWPALMYQVSIPRETTRRLNVLERAMLGLCQAGAAREAARWLRIHEELALFILASLQQRGYVDSYGVCTQLGEEMLQEGSAEGTETRQMEWQPAWVFQDPWNGELWPRVVTTLEYAEVDRSGEYPRLVLGDHGDRKKLSLFAQKWPAARWEGKPGAEDILRANRAHGRARRLRDSLQSDKGEAALDVALRPEALQRVTFIEPRPRPVYLTSRLYLTDEDGGSDWYAADPFGLGTSPLLKAWINRRREENPPLTNLLKSLLEHSSHKSMADLESWQAALHSRAVQNVELNTSFGFRQSPCFAHMVSVEMARLECDELAERAIAYKQEAVRTEMRKLAEAILIELARRYPLKGVARSLPWNAPGICRQMYVHAATACGFPGEAFPGKLRTMKKDLIQNVADHGHNFRLRPLIVATLLKARYIPDHPIHAVGQANPGLLHDFDVIADAGGRTAHAQTDGGSSATDLRAEQMDLLERCYRLTRLIDSTH